MEDIIKEIIRLIIATIIVIISAIVSVVFWHPVITIVVFTITGYILGRYILNWED